jgi:hypothetical protein
MIRWSLIDLLRDRSLAAQLLRRDVNQGTCRIFCIGPAGAGELVLESGWVVHARYADRVGEEAGVALLEEPHLTISLERNRPILHRSMHLSSDELLQRQRLARRAQRAAAAAQPYAVR